MSDIRGRLFAPCIEERESGAIVGDPAGLIRRLLLFDQQIIDSIQLQEIPAFVRAFGFDGVTSLLRSQAVDIKCDFALIAQANELPNGRPLPDSCFRPVRIVAHNHTQFVHDCMSDLHASEGLGLNRKQVIRLKETIASRLIEHDPMLGQASLDELHSSLRANLPIVKRAIIVRVRQTLNITLQESAFTCIFHQIEPNICEVDTNLDQVLRVDAKSVRKIIGEALIAVGQLDVRLEEMQKHSALPALREDERELLTERFSFLFSQLSVDIQEDRWARVLNIANLPSYDPELDKFDMEKFLAVRQTPECIDFRHWLSTTDDLNDTELSDRIRSLRERLGNVLARNSVKATRWVATTAVGFIPGVAPVVGAATSFIDTFLTEKVFPHSGALAFLTSTYPSLFKPSKHCGHLGPWLGRGPEPQ